MMDTWGSWRIKCREGGRAVLIRGLLGRQEMLPICGVLVNSWIINCLFITRCCVTLCAHILEPQEFMFYKRGTTGTVLSAQHRDWCVRGSSKCLLNEWTSTHGKYKATPTSALNTPASAWTPWALQDVRLYVVWSLGLLLAKPWYLGEILHLLVSGAISSFVSRGCNDVWVNACKGTKL